MDQITLAGFGIIVSIILIGIGMPVALSLFLVGFLGIQHMMGFDKALSSLYITSYQIITTHGLAVLPFFVLIGSLTITGKIGGEAFEAANRWLGRLPGGVGMATITASTLFGACCGSSVAASATMGKLCIPSMKNLKYSGMLSTSTCAAGALIATLIPPSSTMVIYGIITEESIGRLLMAGIMPGLMLSIVFMVLIYAICKINPDMGPRGDKFTWREKFSSLPKVWGVFLLMICVIGGIFLGFLTPTEAGAGGSIIAGAILITRFKGGSWRPLVEAFWDCAGVTAMIFFIILGASVFSAFILMAGLPSLIANAVAESGLSPYPVIVGIIIIYIPLGMFLDAAAMLLLSIPIFYPIIIKLGFDGVWFGVIVTMMMEIGLLTPPVGMNCYILSGIAPEVPLTTIFRGALMFVMAELLLVFLIVAYPQITLWLPGLMMAHP